MPTVFLLLRLFPAPEVVENLAVPGGIKVRALSSNTFDNTTELQSFFGRVNYSIAGKYILTATVRADGSSNFGGNNQYGIFPSGAFAWQSKRRRFYS